MLKKIKITTTTSQITLGLLIRANPEVTKFHKGETYPYIDSYGEKSEIELLQSYEQLYKFWYAKKLKSQHDRFHGGMAEIKLASRIENIDSFYINQPSATKYEWLQKSTKITLPETSSRERALENEHKIYTKLGKATFFAKTQRKSAKLKLLIPYIEGQDLRNYARNMISKYPLSIDNLKNVAQLFLLCAKEIKKFHAKGYIHCDIKRGNIIVQLNDNNEVIAARLIDFGLSKEKGMFVQSRFGTRAYIAPEILTLNHGETIRLSEAIDVFSFGALCAKLFFNITSYIPAVLIQKIKNHIKHNSNDANIEIIGNLILKMLNLNSLKRPKFDEVIKSLENIIQSLSSTYNPKQVKATEDTSSSSTSTRLLTKARKLRPGSIPPLKERPSY